MGNIPETDIYEAIDECDDVKKRLLSLSLFDVIL